MYRLIWIVLTLAGGARALAAEPEPAPSAGEMVQPRLLHPVTPEYPPEAQGRSGSVKLVVRIDETGAVIAVTPEAGAPEVFVPAAVAAAQALRFTPATFNGVPVPVNFAVTFGFFPPTPPLPPPPAADDGVPSADVLVEAEAAPLTSASSGAGDFDLAVQLYDAVPRAGAAEMLTLAPGIFLTQLGGAGHPEQIFLRGFDAREGQDIEFTLDGMPLNDVENPHGHGLVDLHFIVPEAVESLRVQEGPFDAAQGDFAVAGSAGYTLGLADPGFLVKGEAGSFDSWRGVAGWRAEAESGTFVIAEGFTTGGYGQNRAGERGSVLARASGGGGALRWHVLGGVSGDQFDSAGLVRVDDVEAGRVDLYGTYDPRQGGSGSRAFVTAGADGADAAGGWSIVAFGGTRGMRLLENYTGFLLDERRPGESDHDQRGDLLEQTYAARTLGVRGRAAREYSVGPVTGTYAAGAFGRYDDTESQAQRLRDQDGAPYRTELDAEVRQTDAAGWVALDATAWERVTLRAGGRLETFLYDLTDHCAAKDGWFAGVEQDDVNCPDQDRYGVRSRSGSRTAFGLGAAPRLSAEVLLTPDLSLTAAYGEGMRSMEATSLSEDESAPFGRIAAEEAGLVWRHLGERWSGQQRLIGFGTHVDHDLVFDEEEGKNVVAGETQRWGGTLDSQVFVGGFSARASVTYTYAVFGEDLPPSYSYYHSDRVPGALIPYVPPWVVRADLAQVWRPFGSVTLTHGVGVDFVSPRPLPLSEWSDPVFTVDLGTSVHWGPVEVGAEVSNLLDARFALAEYNFASYFPDSSGSSYPSRVATRQVSPGAPRAFTVSLTLRPGAPLPGGKESE